MLDAEVTELYHSESDARLKKIKNYTLELLNGGDYRHKEDKENIKVEGIKQKIEGQTFIIQLYVRGNGVTP